MSIIGSVGCFVVFYVVASLMQGHDRLLPWWERRSAFLQFLGLGPGVAAMQLVGLFVSVQWYMRQDMLPDILDLFEHCRFKLFACYRK